MFGDLFKKSKGENHYSEEDYAPFDQTNDGYAKSKI